LPLEREFSSALICLLDLSKANHARCFKTVSDIFQNVCLSFSFTSNYTASIHEWFPLKEVASFPLAKCFLITQQSGKESKGQTQNVFFKNHIYS